MPDIALNLTGMLVGLLLWLVAVAVALMLLTILFPRLERRDDERWVAPPRQPPTLRQPLAQRPTPPLTIVETPATAALSPAAQAAYWRANLRLIAGLLAIWAACSFVPPLLAPWLNQVEILTGFPLGYYMGSQGAPLVFLGLTVAYTWIMSRRDERLGGRSGQFALRRTPGTLRSLLLLVGCAGALLLVNLIAPQSTTAIGWGLIALTFVGYAAIGITSRTASLDEYYVAGRRIPALFNGMALAADWMSAATVISLAGTLWLLGYEGLAYIVGWTGGFVLLALLLAPYLRKFGQYTIPDFIGARYASTVARITAAVIAVIVSFTYLTAQVSGIGIIMGRFLGVNYFFGVAVGLGVVLFCSVLGGMKAVTWTQVAQAVVIVLTYLVPVTWLSLKDTGVALPQLMYGQAFDTIERLEREQGIVRAYAAPFNDWTIWNYLALITCLMCGTAGLPHILMRFYTTPSVGHARRSVSWGLLCIVIVYLTIPAYAAFSRWEFLAYVVGRPVRELPDWAASWGSAGLIEITDLTTLDGRPVRELPDWALRRINEGRLTLDDRNGDGRVQLGELGGRAVTPSASDGILQYSELTISPDVIVLSTPEIVGLPDAIAALVAAGGLAAALSTADGLLIVITSAVAHDIFFGAIKRRGERGDGLRVGRVAMLCAAMLAALTALRQLGIILELVAWAFSLAAATIFPALALGIFWRRANKYGAVAGMLAGFVVTVGYIALNRGYPELSVLGITSPAAGIFGMPVGFVANVLVSRLTPPPPSDTQLLIDALRRP